MDDTKTPPSEVTNHGQILFALGSITGEMKGMREEMQGLKDAKIAQNGKVDILRSDINIIQQKQLTEIAKEKGIKSVYVAIIASIAFIIGSVLIPLVSAYIQK